MPDTSLIVFTDLDGCLLDDVTYRWESAASALQALQQADVPLVLASSKTRAEMVPLAHDLGLAEGPGCRYPLVVENGGGVLMPGEWAPDPSVDAVRMPHGWMVTLGAPTAILRDALRTIADHCGVSTRGFSAMTDEEVAALTGLSVDRAARARQRELDEPFVVLDDGQPLDADSPGVDAVLTCLRDGAEARGLRLTRGGRFLHLTGDADKGRAADLVLHAWTEERGQRSFFENRKMGAAPFLRATEKGGCPHFHSIALGDAPNDLSMLHLVDEAVIIPRPDGRPHAQLRAALPHAMVAPHPGPAGWNAAVLELLRRHHAVR